MIFVITLNWTVRLQGNYSFLLSSCIRTACFPFVFGCQGKHLACSCILSAQKGNSDTQKDYWLNWNSSSHMKVIHTFILLRHHVYYNWIYYQTQYFKTNQFQCLLKGISKLKTLKWKKQHPVYCRLDRPSSCHSSEEHTLA